MSGWFSGKRARIVWRVGAVALIHICVFAAVLSYRLHPIPGAVFDSVEIQFAQIEAEPVEVDPLEIVSPSQVERVTEAFTPLQPVEPKAVSSPTETELEIAPSVLMQDAPAEREVPLSSAIEDTEPSNEPVTLSNSELATLVQTLNCQGLVQHRNIECPKLDPFDVAAASLERVQAAPAPPQLVGDFGPNSYLEEFLSQKDRDPYLMPGMSADLFTPAMPKGAYNAQRIREGKTPLWDEEIEAGFTRNE